MGLLEGFNRLFSISRQGDQTWNELSLGVMESESNDQDAVSEFLKWASVVTFIACGITGASGGIESINTVGWYFAALFGIASLMVSTKADTNRSIIEKHIDLVMEKEWESWAPQLQAHLPGPDQMDEPGIREVTLQTPPEIVALLRHRNETDGRNILDLQKKQLGYYTDGWVHLDIVDDEAPESAEGTGYSCSHSENRPFKHRVVIGLDPSEEASKSMLQWADAVKQKGLGVTVIWLSSL